MAKRNELKLAKLETAMSDLLHEVLQSGFYGKATIEINVQDGTIQLIRRMVERIER